jgi:DNA polymerase-4/DNA polymerase V
MFNIIRKYTPVVEEYSVDEAFADITGLRRLYRCSYEEIALKISGAIHEELNLTVSTGLSLSKSLAKLCSKFRKPAGFTAVPGRYIHVLLQKIPLHKVWGIGPSGVELLGKYGVRTAYDFVNKECCWAEKLLHKPGREIWNELRGNSIWKVTAEEKTSYASIIKSKTFTPPSSDKAFVYAKLIRNMESAFMKARRHRLRPKVIGVVLRHSDFRHDGLEAKLNRPTSSTVEAVPMVRRLFDRIFLENSKYRATMIMLGELEGDNVEQYELFEDRLKIESFKDAARAIDVINRKHGKHTLCSATSLFMNNKPKDSRAALPARRRITVEGESSRQRLGIPRMDISV